MHNIKSADAYSALFIIPFNLKSTIAMSLIQLLSTSNNCQYMCSLSSCVRGYLVSLLFIKFLLICNLLKKQYLLVFSNTFECVREGTLSIYIMLKFPVFSIHVCLISSYIYIYISTRTKMRFFSYTAWTPNLIFYSYLFFWHQNVNCWNS